MIEPKNEPYPNWAFFEEAFLGFCFPWEQKHAKVREFITLKQDSLSVHEYGLKFTQQSRYALEMAKDMWSRMSLFVFGFVHTSNNDGWDSMLIGEMDIYTSMDYKQQVEEEKFRNTKEYWNKTSKTGNEFGQ